MVEKVRDVIEALNTFNEVRMACFSQTIDPDYKTYISSFADAYVKLGIYVTPKVHAVLVHVPQFSIQEHRSRPWSLFQTGVRIITL